LATSVKNQRGTGARPSTDPGLSRHALISDPDPVFASAMVQFVRDQGWEASIAPDGLDSSLPGDAVQFVLVDVSPAGIPDFTLLKRLRTQNARAIIVAVTVQISARLVITLIRQGADDCLFKPTTPAEVWLTFQHAMSAARFFS
jgi:DNA-binding response OmpR family regulator